MTASASASASTGQRPYDAPSVDAEAARPDRPPGRARTRRRGTRGIPDQPTVAVLLLMGVAVLLVASGYALGRTRHQSLGLALYWTGEILLLLPAIALLLLRRTRRDQALAVVLLLGIASYTIKVCYSPIRFRFPDELQHLRTLVDLMNAGDLSTPNPALPISTSFPGLELVTAAVCSLTGLGTFGAGLVVIGIAHVVQGVMLFHLIEVVARSWRVGAVGVLVYATNPHYQHFNSLFIYQAMATGLLAACLWQLARAVEPVDGVHRIRRGPMVASLVLGLAIVPTHHVTTYAMLALGAVMLVGLLIRRDAHRARGLALLVGVVGIAAAWWALSVGSHVITYLEPAARSLLDGFSTFFGTKKSDGAAPPQAGAFIEQIAAYVSVLVLAGALAWTGWRVHRPPRPRSWVYAMWLASLTYLGAVGVRLASADGAELYGRAVSFVFVPLAVVVAIAMLTLSQRLYPRLVPVAVFGLAAVYGGGVASGWPPSWERLPRGYLPAGYESSIEKQGITSARWVHDNLPPYGGIAADYTNYTLMGTIGRQRSARTVADLYASPTLTARDRAIIKERSLDHVLTDLRLTQELPAFGSYFPDDPNAFRYTQPLEPGRLTKFATMPQTSRIYDSGDIAIYDVRAARDD